MRGIILNIGGESYRLKSDAAEAGRFEFKTGDGIWELALFTDAALTILYSAPTVDIFMTGGGGGGGTAGGSTTTGCSGGTGGEIRTLWGVSCERGEEYPVLIGAGGAANTDGGETRVLGFSAAGGKHGSASYNTTNTKTGCKSGGKPAGGTGTAPSGAGEDGDYAYGIRNSSLIFPERRFAPGGSGGGRSYFDPGGTGWHTGSGKKVSAADGGGKGSDAGTQSDTDAAADSYGAGGGGGGTRDNGYGTVTHTGGGAGSAGIVIIRGET